MLEKISMVHQLSDSDEALRAFIFKNPEQIFKLSAREIAAKIPCSPSTVTRFVKKCGFLSFHDFQIYIRNEVESIIETSMTNRIFLEQIFVDQVFEADINEQIKRVGEVFRTANWICCIGMGSSGIMAEYAARKLNMIGLKALSSNEPYAPFLKQEAKESGNVVLLFSSSGETREMVELAQLLKSYDKLIISVTNSSDNLLAKLSSINLCYYTEKQRLSYQFDLSSQVPVVALIEYLVAYCYNLQAAEN
ncbi:MurR/RpiR family transcriptional regulator [Listeria aquatica]|uniref:MurR/RpiR family transcriptional regulator n=1 Tax=Listeria aquatica TaxID=1494960 RepID=UPI0031F5295B